MIASIKLLNISLVLLCIATTAFICTYLAITSNQVALDDTKTSRDDSVSSAFTVGSESVTERTVEYIDLLMESTMEFLEHFTKAHRLASTSLARELEAATWDEIKTMDWHRLPRYYYHYNLLRPDGNSGITVLLRNRLVIIEYEAIPTLTNPPNGTHELRVLMNYGDDSPMGGYGRSFTALNDGKGGPLNVTNPLTDVNWNLSSCRVPSNATWAEPNEPCAATSLWTDPLDHSSYWVPQWSMEPGQTLWGPPVAADIHVGITCFSTVYHNGVFSGAVTSQADIRHISEYLSTIQIGGPVAGYPSRGRLFVTMRSTMLYLIGGAGNEMVGTSHGDTIYYDPWIHDPHPMRPELSNDYIISTIGQTINTTSDPGLEDLVKMGNYTVLNISTPYKPDGEEFYYRVGNLKDDYGVDWYVHVVIDRAYILGSIDKKVAETRSDIHVSEQNVDDNLERARIILYISVAAVAVGLTALSTLLVFRIIEPLVVLEKEMAAVAVMNLEGVDTGRPLSALQEVRLMQVSFLQMIRNLVEYRNYMPASVLQQVSDSDSETPRCSEAEGSGSTVTASNKSAKGAGKPQVLLGSEVHVRKVTLMVCNIVDFLNVCEVVRVQQVITNYLSAGLHHIKVSKGIPDSFSGDRLYASWNGVRACASHRFAAYHCAKDMCADKGIGARLSIGLASGDVKCGNMGCDGMKKFSFIGSLSSWVHVVERIGRSMECEVAVDAVVNEEVHNRAYTRMLQHVMFAKMGEQVLVVHEALDMRESTREEEWMYQLEERQANDPYKAYNTSYELFMNGRARDALGMLGDYDDGTRVFAKYKARLCAAAADPSLCGPLGKDGTIISW